MIEISKPSDPSLVYMYGLSDFWVDMFGDRNLVETLLQGETVQLAEAYSYFLQRSSGISLEDIQEKYQTRIKLLLLSESDLVDPSDRSSFKIDAGIESISKIANRPVLPTQTLSYGIHFDIQDNIIKFHKPIDQLKFPVRYNTDGTWQYAIWMCDVEIDERWIDNSFGRLVGFTEDDAIFNYKSFLEGVYYLYTNGPNLSYIVRGVNLAMGMPYARDTEVVLDISQDEVTSNWVVFTSNHSYEIPYSYRPDLVIGDTLTEGEVLSTWVEVRDYSTSGAWWYQIYLPREVLGENIDPYELGKAVAGSTADKMMQNFLKHHMFEVLITQPSSDITAFNTARDLVLRAKPEYTYPVFVWRAAVDDELIHLDEDLSYNYLSQLTDTCVPPPSIRFMDRSTENDRFSRGINWYNRVQGSMYAATLIGYGDWPGNAGWAPQFDSVEDNYLEYMNTLMRTRGDIVSPISRGTITRGWRGHVDNMESGVPLNDTPIGIKWTVDQGSVYGSSNLEYTLCERNMTPLYMMNRTELIDKMRTISPNFSINGRNKFVVQGLNLQALYDTWVLRNDSVDELYSDEFRFEYSTGDLENSFSPFAFQTYVPNKSDMPTSDGVLFITRSTDRAWVCQWVQTDVNTSPTLFPIEDQSWLKAVENYTFERIGEQEYNVGYYVNKSIDYIETDTLVSGTQDVILIVDGQYVSTTEYYIDVINSRAEVPQYDPSDPESVDLGIPSRSFVTIFSPPEDRGYLVYSPTGLYMTMEEFVSPDSPGVYTLSETPLREEILVIKDGEFIFDYTISGDELSVPGATETLIVRYVNYRDEQVLPAGSSEYTLSEDNPCKIFIGSRLLEDWECIRQGVSLKLSSDALEDLTIRYHSSDKGIKVSHFNRSSVESNQARFLMDRSRVGGEYEDYLGNTVYMDRSGIAKDSNGLEADSVNVIRRLR